MQRLSWSLLAKAIIWQIWLGRNECIFNFITISLSSSILTTSHLFIFWVSAALESKKHKQESVSAAIKRSIQFSGLPLVTMMMVPSHSPASMQPCFSAPYPRRNPSLTLGATFYFVLFSCCFHFQWNSFILFFFLFSSIFCTFCVSVFCICFFSF